MTVLQLSVEFRKGRIARVGAFQVLLGGVEGYEKESELVLDLFE